MEDARQDKQTLATVVVSWEELMFRPIASYHKHTWAPGLSLASKFCTTALKAFRWGFNSDDPRRIVHEIRCFVNRLEKGRGWSDTRISVADVDSFFPNMDAKLLEAGVRAAIEELQKINGTWYWF